MTIMQRKDGLWVPEENPAYYNQIADGIYNKPLFDASMKHIKEFDVALDLGAHVGTWTKAMSGKFKRVISFEFAEDAVKCFLVNNSDNAPYVICNPVMHAPVFVGIEPRGSSLSTSIKLEGDKQATYIDAYMAKGKVTFIKMNIEGAEPYALMGGVMTIMRDHPVITLEYKHEHRFGFPKGFCERFLKELGYKQVERIEHSDIYVWGGK